jgi:hypothetical protein
VASVNIGTLEAVIRLNDQMTPAMKKTLGTLKDAAIAFGALATAAVVVNKALEAQAAQEDAINKLNLALANQGIYTAKTSKALVDYSGALQQTSVFGDEVILAGEAMLVSFGQNEEQVKRTTQAALDFASATGTDVQTAVELLGKAYAGNTAALSRYGIIVDQNIPKGKQFESVLGQIEGRFSGSALNATKTYSGQVKQLENDFGDLMEALGLASGALLDTGEAADKSRGALRTLSEFIRTDLILAISEAKASWEELLAGMNESMARSVEAQLAELERLKAKGASLKDIAGGAAGTKIQAVADLAEQARQEGQSLDDLIKKVRAHAVALEGTANSQQKAANGIRDTADAAVDAGGKVQTFANNTKNTKPPLEDLKKAAEEAKKEIEALAQSMGAFFDQAAKTRGAREDLGSLLGPSVQDATTQMGRLVEATEGFGKVSGTVGDLSDAQLVKLINDMREQIELGGENTAGFELLGKAMEEAGARGDHVWAAVGGAVEKTGEQIRQATKETLTFGQSLSQALASAPQAIMGALQGGGDVGKSLGGLFGGSIFGKDSSLVKSISGGLGRALGSGIGGALGSAIPGLGTILGSGIGSLAGSLFGKLGGLFGGGEEKKVNDLRDSFFQAQGGFEAFSKSMSAVSNEDWAKKIFDAKTVDDFNNLVKESQSLLDTQGEAQKALDDAVQRYGFTVDQLGPKFRQQKLDEQATGLLKDFQLLTASGINVGVVGEKMSASVSDYLQNAIKAGVGVPEAMRPMLEQMLKLGELTDKSGKKLTDLSGVNFTQTLTEGIQSAVEAINKLVDALTGVQRTAGQGITLPVTTPGATGRNPHLGDFASGVSDMPISRSGLYTIGLDAGERLSVSPEGGGVSGGNVTTQYNSFTLIAQPSESPEQFGARVAASINRNLGGARDSAIAAPKGRTT